MASNQVVTMATLLNLTVPKLVDFTFGLVQHEFKNGTKTNYLLPLDFKKIVGDHGVTSLGELLQEVAGKPVLLQHQAFEDGYEVLCLYIDEGPLISEMNLNQKKGTKTFSKSLREKIPRPPNAFILYRQYWSKTIRADPKYDGLCANNGEMSRIIAGLWKAEPEENRQYWGNQAQDAKQRHAEKHPDYSYSPRSSSSIERRMTQENALQVPEVIKKVCDLNGILYPLIVFEAQANRPETLVNIPVQNLQIHNNGMQINLGNDFGNEPEVPLIAPGALQALMHSDHRYLPVSLSHGHLMRPFTRARHQVQPENVNIPGEDDFFI